MHLTQQYLILIGPAYCMDQFTKLAVFLLIFFLKWLRLVFPPKKLRLDRTTNLGTIQKLDELHVSETD